MEGRRGHLVNLARRKIGAENVAARIGNEIDLVAAPDHFLAKRLGGEKVAARSTGRQHDRTAAHGSVSLPGVIAKSPTPGKAWEAHLNMDRFVKATIMPRVIAVARSEDRP